MKKFLSLLLALTMAVSLAACGAGTASDPQGSQPGSAVSEPPASAEPEATPDPTEETPKPTQEPDGGDISSILVVYFSATGNTEGIAQYLQAILDTDLYEIVPAEPYSDDDLNYNASDCRANQEQNDPDARPAINGSVRNIWRP